MWVRVRSTRVTCAVLPRPRLSPSLVASSSPAAPPPTMTMWCIEGSGTQTRVGLLGTAGLGGAREGGCGGGGGVARGVCCAPAATVVLGLFAAVSPPPSPGVFLVLFEPAYLSG